VSALVVDSSSWISYFRGTGAPEIIEDALALDAVFLPPVVAAELASGRLSRRQRAELRDFLIDLPACETSLEHWLCVGELRSRLARAGVRISTPDAHVAQCALDLRARLLTEDAIFRKIAAHTALTLA